MANSVFPTCVGVFPLPEELPARPLRLPHVRGGVSVRTRIDQKRQESSPRAWGCF